MVKTSEKKKKKHPKNPPTKATSSLMSLCIVSLASSPCSCVSQFCNSTWKTFSTENFTNCWKIKNTNQRRFLGCFVSFWAEWDSDCLMLSDQRLGLEKNCIEFYCKDPQLSNVVRNFTIQAPVVAKQCHVHCHCCCAVQKSWRLSQNEGVCTWLSFVCQRLIQAFMSSTSFKILFPLFSDSDLGNSL